MRPAESREAGRRTTRRTEVVALDGIEEPVSRALLAVLRRAVADHAATEGRRIYPPLLHVGWPGGRENVFAAEPGDRLDHARRWDVVAALLCRGLRTAPVRGAVPLLWLTRSGPMEAGDVDQLWVAATRSAAAEAEVEPTFVVVTRRGWFDPRTDVGREWKRLRAR